ALLDATARDRLLHRDHDDVADSGVFALGAAQHLDAHDAARAGIVRHIEVGLHLDHEVPRTSFFRTYRAVSSPWPRGPPRPSRHASSKRASRTRLRSALPSWRASRPGSPPSA